MKLVTATAVVLGAGLLISYVASLDPPLIEGMVIIVRTVTLILTNGAVG